MLVEVVAVCGMFHVLLKRPRAAGTTSREFCMTKTHWIIAHGVSKDPSFDLKLSMKSWRDVWVAGQSMREWQRNGAWVETNLRAAVDSWCLDSSPPHSSAAWKSWNPQPSWSATTPRTGSRLQTFTRKTFRQVADKCRDQLNTNGKHTHRCTQS